MKNLAVKLLDVFVYKYEKKFQKGNYNISGANFMPNSNIVHPINNNSA